MRFSWVAAWVRAAVLSLAVALPQPGLSATTIWAASVAAVVFSAPSDAWARKSSSGGYSRSSSSSRTPSTSTRSSSRSSGGYTKPRTPSASSATSSRSRSAGDTALSRQGASDALKRFRDEQAPVTSTSRRDRDTGRETVRRDRDDGWIDWATSNNARRHRTTTVRFRDLPHSSWYGKRGWAPPAYAQVGHRFGIWDAAFLWYMLETASTPSHAAFFHNQQNDPGVQAFRAEAKSLAAEEDALRPKVAQLDAALDGLADSPAQPDQLPPDITTAIATGSTSNLSLAAFRAEAAEEEGGFGLIAVVIILGGVIFVLWLARRRRAGGAGEREEESVQRGFIGNYIDQKISGRTYQPSLFRVGMTVTIDPTPFLLAAGITKVAAPDVSGSDQLTSIESLGVLKSGKATLYRLYLPEGQSFFQIHLDKAGAPDECRYFTVIDQVEPADAEEWAFWLDKREGTIGWSEFQTKDDKLYGRTWSPGSSRIAPFKMTEEVKDVRGSRTVTLESMLYSAPTGAAAPAPETEYVLVSAVQDGDQAWVEIAAGIDVNPASLSLS